ncbi:MAG: hypothetical protein QGH77_05325, partial [Planctomycetota bacterium]|nr:hypothetical protein [Planctomycetota bacterium]
TTRTQRHQTESPSHESHRRHRTRRALPAEILSSKPSMHLLAGAYLAYAIFLNGAAPNGEAL